MLWPKRQQRGIVDVAPKLSILIPTFGRAEFLRALLARIAAQAAMLPVGSIEIVVSDNRSRDHTAKVLRSAQVNIPCLRVVRPTRHFPSAEENVHFGLLACRGDYVWGIGDDDEISEGGLEAIFARLDGTVDFLIFNVATMAGDGEITRSRLLKMHAEELAWPLERIVAAVGLMALSACLTAVVCKRAMLVGADWRAHLDRSPIYAHVVAYLEAFGNGDCRLLDRAPAVARQGATGIAEFASFADATGQNVYWPWTVGLARHLEWLVRNGVVTPDFPARILEPQNGTRYRFLPAQLRGVVLQIERWVAEKDERLAIEDTDLDHWALMAAGAQLRERETVRELSLATQAAASFIRKDGPSANLAFASFPTAQKEQVADALGIDLTRGDAAEGAGRYRALAAVMRSKGRNADSKSNQNLSLRTIILGLSRDDRIAAEAVLSVSLISWLRQISASFELDLVPASANLLDDWGIRRLPLGGVYVGLLSSERLTAEQREDLETVDPAGDDEILIAPDRGTLDQRLQVHFDARIGDFISDEEFLGWQLGLSRGRQAACRTQGGRARMIVNVETRPDLRRQILRMRRADLLKPETESPPSIHSAISEGDRKKVAFLFDSQWYLGRYEFARKAIEKGDFSDALDHWLAVGAKLGLSPSLWFDGDDYFALYPEVLQQIEEGVFPSAAHHYLCQGADEGKRPFALFDPEFYLATYPDARGAIDQGVTPLEHFLNVGIDKQYEVSEGFSSESYLALNRDVAEAVKKGEIVSALMHYLAHGKDEGRAAPRALKSGKRK